VTGHRRMATPAEKARLSADEPPRMLWRYRSTDEHQLKDLFEYSRCYFSSPSDLNDPFDCTPALRSPTSADLLGYVLRRGQRHFNSVDSSKRRLLKREVRKRQQSPAFREAALEHAIARYGVLCLSEAPDSLLMWAHYADNHKGFCVGFDCSNPEAMPIGLAMQVEYVAERPQVNPLTLYQEDPGDLVRQCFLIKSRHWEYEREWRLITDGGIGHHSFDRHLLRRVHLGCNMSDQDRDALLGRLRDWPDSLRPEVYRVRLHRQRFELELDREVI
jgi:hypothetical protein